jgi:hypothetical protein
VMTVRSADRMAAAVMTGRRHRDLPFCNVVRFRNRRQIYINWGRWYIRTRYSLYIPNNYVKVMFWHRRLFIMLLNLHSSGSD